MDPNQQSPASKSNIPTPAQAAANAKRTSLGTSAIPSRLPTSNIS